jgi:hypothetical protein
MCLAPFAAVILLATTAAAQQWQRLPGTLHPPMDADVAMAFDPLRSRLVCVADERITASPFGTQGRTTTWEWDGSRWLARTTATTPTGLARRHAIAWHAQLGRVWLFNHAGETWSYDGVDWQLEPITGPANQTDPCLVYDPARDVMVLLSDSWLYELSGGAWLLRATIPGTLTYDRAAGFDASTGRVIVFGGWLASGGNNTNTLAWDGTTLVTLSPATTPPGRSEHTLATDPGNGELLLLGGADYFSPQQWLTDVHAWTGSDWSPRTPLPIARRHPAAAAFAGLLYLFGGELEPTGGAAQAHSHELLLLAGAGAWATLPLPATGRLAAHDPVRARTVSVDADRTLEFDGDAWADVGIGFPGSGEVAALAFFPPAGHIVAIDGAGATWRYDGSTWTAIATPLALSPRTGCGLAYDPTRQRLVLFGGLDAGLGALDDVWEWDGAAWSQPLPATRPPAGSNAMAWDGQRVVMVTPQVGAAVTSTWTWNGLAWSHLNDLPAPYLEPRLALDPVHGLTLLASTFPIFGSSDHTFRLVGNSWQATPFVLDARPSSGALVFDGNRGALVAHDARQRRDHVLTPLPATAASYGTGCSNGPLVPRLHAANLPQVGTAMTSDLDRTEPGSAAFLFFDPVGANVPIGGGCSALIANLNLLGGAVTSAGGFASWSWPVPTSPAMLGQFVHEQALVLAANGALFGFADLSGGLQLRLGD